MATAHSPELGTSACTETGRTAAPVSMVVESMVTAAGLTVLGRMAIAERALAIEPAIAGDILHSSIERSRGRHLAGLFVFCARPAILHLLNHPVSAMTTPRGLGGRPW